MILVDDLVVRVGLWGFGSDYIFPGEMKNKKCKTVILEFRTNPVHHLTILELSIKSPCLWTCFHPLSPVSWKMLNRPKKLSVQKVLLRFFPQSAICPVCFYLVIPNHFLGLCYACLDML